MPLIDNRNTKFGPKSADFICSNKDCTEKTGTYRTGYWIKGKIINAYLKYPNKPLEQEETNSVDGNESDS